MGCATRDVCRGAVILRMHADVGVAIALLYLLLLFVLHAPHVAFSMPAMLNDELCVARFWIWYFPSAFCYEGNLTYCEML